MDIAVAADGAVDFKYDGEFGRLEGRVDGVRLTGRFAEDNGARGDIVLTLGRENRTFSGQWRRTDIDDDYWHGCEGWRPFEAGRREPAPAAGPSRAGGGRFGLGGELGGDDRRPGPAGGRGDAVKGGYDGDVRPHRRPEPRAAGSSAASMRTPAAGASSNSSSSRAAAPSRADGGA